MHNESHHQQPNYYYGGGVVAGPAEEIDFITSNEFDGEFSRMNNGRFFYEDDADYSIGRFEFSGSQDSVHPEPIGEEIQFQQYQPTSNLAIYQVNAHQEPTSTVIHACENRTMPTNEESHSSNGTFPLQQQNSYQLNLFQGQQELQQQLAQPIADEQQQQQHAGPRLNVKQKAIQRKKAIEKRQVVIVAPVLNEEELEEAEELDKKKLQKIKNRISAQRSRDLKKVEFTDLRDQVSQLTLENEELRMENKKLHDLHSRSVCSRCQSDSTTGCDTNSDFSSEDAYISAMTANTGAASTSAVEAANSLLLSSSLSSSSFEYVRERRQSRGSASFSPVTIMILLGIVLCVGMTSTSISLSGNKNSISENVGTGVVQGNYLMLNEMPRNFNGNNQENQMCSCDNSNRNNSTASEAIARLVAMNGINPNNLNFNTKIVDSRVNQRTNELSYSILEESNENQDESTDSASSQAACEQNITTIKPKQMNDQIYCSDPLIFLNNLSQEQKEGKKYIDLVYSTDLAKTFIQFGDHYFQTKADGSDKYVQLTCQVVNYYSRDM